MSAGRTGGLFLLAVSATALAGCGKSTETRRADAVKCAGYVQVIDLANIGMVVGGDFARAVKAAVAGRPSGNPARLQAVVQLGEQIAPTLDPAKSMAAAQDGGMVWRTHIQGKDVAGSVSFLDACVDNNEALVAAAR